jgi:penicillin-binding protein 1C
VLNIAKIKEVFVTKRTIQRGFAALLVLLGIGLLLDRVIFPLPLDNIYKPSAKFIYASDKSLLAAYSARDSYWRKPVTLPEISPLLIKSVIAREDRWFYYHPGVNLLSLMEATVSNIKAGEVVRGGSTISMQVARMMEPKARTFKAKVIELTRAIQLELHYSKKEILELYFNLAPYGGNIEGVGAASYFYFGKTPLELSASQAALLTSIPNSPTALRPDINHARSLKARDKVLKVMLEKGIVSGSKYHEALAEEIKPRKTEPPNKAAHFSRELADNYPNQVSIYSTLDTKIQNISEGIVRNHKGDLQAWGISNTAVVVMKNSTAGILAMVGSTDFYDTQHQGQVNGAMAPRSPGSALKPFVYAMALDSGLISPNTLIEDVPINYSGYAPENYDRQYRGAVSAAEALRLSLNVPAVQICSKIGQRKFFRLLKDGGLSTLNRKDSEYGLPIILGACEVRLVDLTALYSSFARTGYYSSPKFTIEKTRLDSIPLFSAASSYIISEVLSELQRPDFPASWEFSPNIPKVAWKTGTSYGRRDAWAIGYNPDYTIGVWVGNFTGEPSPDLVGAEAAAPILFDIFSSIATGPEIRWFEQPQSVSTRQVCAVSGLPPNDFCPVTINELYIPGVSPVAKCKIHEQVLIDSETGQRLCPYCREGKKYESKVFEDWPPKLATWLGKAGKVIAPIPPHYADCTGSSHGDKPIIISPLPDVTYIVRDYIPLSDQEIALEASVASNAHEIYWFIDGVLFSKLGVGEKAFYRPISGVHKLTCSDEEGRSTSMTLTVQ